jgi:hypothetical protein
MDITEDSLPLISVDSLPAFQSKVYHFGAVAEFISVESLPLSGRS